MRRGVTAVALALALAAGAGCSLLVGATLDYYEVDGGGAAGGAGGASSSSSSSSSGTNCTTSTGSVSNSGGDAGHGCPPNADACGPGMRCTILDESTGASGCVAVQSAPVAAFGGCNHDSDCAAGTWCDRYSTGVCKPFCASPADCASGASCITAQGNGGTIPDLLVCTAHCKPDQGSPPCGSGTTCQYFGNANTPDFDCFSSNNEVAGTPCTGNSSVGDCAQGLVCNGSKCTPWCAPVGASSPSCADGGVCQAWQGHSYGGVQYGACP